MILFFLIAPQFYNKKLIRRGMIATCIVGCFQKAGNSVTQVLFKEFTLKPHKNLLLSTTCLVFAIQQQLAQCLWLLCLTVENEN